MQDIYLKIYMENEDTLVLEGQGMEEKEGYYPARWDDIAHRFGTVVVGKEHIAITEDAKDAFRRIVNGARHTGDDLSYIDIHRIHKRIGKVFEEYPTEVCVSYLGKVVTKLSIEKVLRDPDFYIGCGEGAPDTQLLDELVLLEQTTKEQGDDTDG